MIHLYITRIDITCANHSIQAYLYTYLKGQGHDSFYDIVRVQYISFYILLIL